MATPKRTEKNLLITPRIYGLIQAAFLYKPRCVEMFFNHRLIVRGSYSRTVYYPIQPQFYFTHLIQWQVILKKAHCVPTLRQNRCIHINTRSHLGRLETRNYSWTWNVCNNDTNRIKRGAFGVFESQFIRCLCIQQDTCLGHQKITLSLGNWETRTPSMDAS